MVGVITVIQQDRDFRNIHRLRPEVVNVVRQHLNHPRIVRKIGASTVREERKPQRIDGEMSLNAIGRFVEAKAFGLNTRIAGILHSL